jgi:hypothetical protein
MAWSRRKRWLVAGVVSVLLVAAFILAGGITAGQVLVTEWTHGNDIDAGEALLRMSFYERLGLRETAIAKGVAWAEHNPDGFINDWIYVYAARLYLYKGEKDPKRLDEYVALAIQYRDKALLSASFDKGGVRQVALLTESIADMSELRRCAQYRNAVRLLERLVVLLEQSPVRKGPPTRTTEHWLTAGEVAAGIEQTNATIERVRHKQQAAGCDP